MKLHKLYAKLFLLVFIFSFGYACSPASNSGNETENESTEIVSDSLKANDNELLDKLEQQMENLQDTVKQ